MTQQTTLGLLHQGLCKAIKNTTSLGVMLAVLGTTPVMACGLKVTDGWIREAPPGMMTLAGYATLQNDSDDPLRIVKLWSTSFGEVEMHQTVVNKGVASMHQIKVLNIPAHHKTQFAPDGRHFMLMGATRQLKTGDAVEINLQDQTGCTTKARFVVRKVSE